MKALTIQETLERDHKEVLQHAMRETIAEIAEVHHQVTVIRAESKTTSNDFPRAMAKLREAREILKLIHVE